MIIQIMKQIKNQDLIIIKDLIFNIKCPICNKDTNLGKIKQHHQSKKCKLLRCKYTDDELDEIANKILLMTIQI